jgi:rRNA maturation protein Rpf1
MGDMLKNIGDNMSIVESEVSPGNFLVMNRITKRLAFERYFSSFREAFSGIPDQEKIPSKITKAIERFLRKSKDEEAVRSLNEFVNNYYVSI